MFKLVQNVWIHLKQKYNLGQILISPNFKSSPYQVRPPMSLVDRPFLRTTSRRECPICLEYVNSAEASCCKNKPCGAMYHRQCIQLWREHNQGQLSCALCTLKTINLKPRKRLGRRPGPQTIHIQPNTSSINQDNNQVANRQSNQVRGSMGSRGARGHRGTSRVMTTHLQTRSNPIIETVHVRSQQRHNYRPNQRPNPHQTQRPQMGQTTTRSSLRCQERSLDIPAIYEETHIRPGRIRNSRLERDGYLRPRSYRDIRNIYERADMEIQEALLNIRERERRVRQV